VTREPAPERRSLWALLLIYAVAVVVAAARGGQTKETGAGENDAIRRVIPRPPAAVGSIVAEDVGDGKGGREAALFRFAQSPGMLSR
jgi:hypothetical protein